MKLRNHVNFGHNGVEKKHKRVGEKTTCNICRKTLSINHVKGHMKTIHGDNPFLFCPECEFSSKYPHSMKIHKKSHTSPDMKCKECSFSTHSHNLLKAHLLNIHPKGDPLFCTKCDYKTLSIKYLKSHETTHDKPTKELKRKGKEGKENPVVICPICPYKAKKESMKLHDEMHLRQGFS